MGIFTWTLADKTPVKRRNGMYSDRDIVMYGGYGAVICPDNSKIEEHYYEGYGIFGGHDVYDLVAEWNRPYLVSLMEKPEFLNDTFVTPVTKDIIVAYGSEDDESLNRILESLSDRDWLKKDWKRTIGIAISCTHNDIIPFPIKIVGKNCSKAYAELSPSISTQ